MSFKIKVDFKQFDKFVKFTRSQAIGIIKRSIRKTVNNQAWITRKFAQKKEIPKSMITRGKFNQRTIRVDPAKGRSLVSEVGNIKFKKYMGLKNLELGKSEKNPAIPHVEEVRGGSKQKKVSKNRQLGSLKPFKRIHTSTQLRLLNHLGNNYTGYFKIQSDFSALNPGIYKFVGRAKRTKNKGQWLRREIEWVRDTTHKRTKPKRNKWLKRSSKYGASPGITSREYKKNMDAELKRIKRLFK